MKKARRWPGFFTRCGHRAGLRQPYLEDDFFEPLRDELDLRAFEPDFFEPLFEPERELDFFAPDLEPDREEDFDEDFLLVVAIAVSFRSPQTGHGNRISRRVEETITRPLQSNNTQTRIKFIH
jgi:hypothetical protein